MSTLFSHFFEKINQISPLEADFTSVLASIALMPKTLYYNGKMPENVVGGALTGAGAGAGRGMDTGATRGGGAGAGGKVGAGAGGDKSAKPVRPKTVAIVGTRKNTAYGEEVAYHLAGELAKRGVVVISGLAYGVDSAAHRGAVDAGGVTIGVLGTPIGEIYPRAHSALAGRMIEKGGAIISEYGPGEEAESGKEIKARFLMRNRLISGLSDVVVVVEAAEHSGSLNTAMHALEQGRELFAVPGNITSKMSQGCNKLITQGAQPYTEPDDILNLLFPPQPKPKQGRLIFGDNPDEVAILTALFDGLRSGEDILKATGMDVATFNRTITLLEIKGAVRALGMNKWMAL